MFRRMDYKRDTTVDFIKGMLILGVVYGHVIHILMSPRQSIWLHTFLRTFDMAFFMILLGYFLRKSLARNGVLRVIGNRVTMIFVPIVLWTLIRGQVNIFGGMYYFLWAVLVSSIYLAILMIAFLLVGIGSARNISFLKWTLEFKIG